MRRRARRRKIGACRRRVASAGHGLRKGNAMVPTPVAGTSADSPSRRPAAGRLAGAGASVAVAAAGLGVPRGAARGAASRLRSSVVATREEIVTTAATAATAAADAAPPTVVLVHGACAEPSKGMRATQRPVTAAALDGASCDPAWKRLPSWFVHGELDRNIPAALHAVMAERAGAKATVAIPGASHVAMISHSPAVTDVIQEAIDAVA